MIEFKIDERVDVRAAVQSRSSMVMQMFLRTDVVGVYFFNVTVFVVDSDEPAREFKVKKKKSRRWKQRAGITQTQCKRWVVTGHNRS